jgi:hypothetical protein
MQNPMTFRNFSGKSGATYLFGQANPNDPTTLPMQGGMFIFAKDKSNDIDIIYIGEADSIYGEIINTTLWNTAKLQYGADLIFGRPRPDPLARAAEARDLIAQWTPPMN